jgi:GT2 family glycosyltransferase
MENKLNPKVSFVVVNYEGKKYLEKCFNSIYSLSYPQKNIEIIFVDNNSGDNSIDYINKNFPEIKTIQNKVNNYCTANNLGIKKAKGDLIFLLNNDAYLEKDCLEILVREIIKEKKIGAVTGKILLENGKIQSTGHVELPNFYFGDRGFMEKDKGQYNKIEEVKSVCFASVLIKKKCIKDVGLLDEDFIMYCEDVDFSIRARKKGWKLVYVPEAVVHHKFRGTGYILNPEDPEKKEKKFVEVNRLLLLAKHYPEKLSKALSTSASFYIKKNYNFIYDNMGLIIKKLYDNNPEKFFKILPKFFKELKKVISFDKSLISVESEINQKLISKDKELKDKEERINNMKKEIKQLKTDFKKREKQLIDDAKRVQKDNKSLLLDLKKIQKALDKEKEMKDELLKKEESKRDEMEKNFKTNEKEQKKIVEEMKNELKKREVEQKKIVEEMKNELKKREKEYEEILLEFKTKLKKKDDLIHEFYSSRGYRLILEPLNAFYELFSSKKRRK